MTDLYGYAPRQRADGNQDNPYPRANMSLVPAGLDIGKQAVHSNRCEEAGCGARNDEDEEQPEVLFEDADEAPEDVAPFASDERVKMPERALREPRGPVVVRQWWKEVVGEVRGAIASVDERIEE